MSLLEEQLDTSSSTEKSVVTQPSAPVVVVPLAPLSSSYAQLLRMQLSRPSYVITSAYKVQMATLFIVVKVIEISKEMTSLDDVFYYKVNTNKHLIMISGQ